MKKVIYDFGANNGDDIPYYLNKADLVVAVEANPSLCSLIRERFKTSIEEGKLVVENYVLTDRRTSGKVAFYIHSENHVLSQLSEPDEELTEKFFRTDLPAVHPVDLVDRHGKPFYIKIDIEHFDAEILQCLFEKQIFPEYVSAESHNPKIFSLLIAEGRYNAFKLVDGRSVVETYKEIPFVTLSGHTQTYTFPFHSAGPFGDDILGDWFSAGAMLIKLGVHGCGWKDIHATSNAVEIMDSSLDREFQVMEPGRIRLATLCKLFAKKVYRRIRRTFGRSYTTAEQDYL